MDEAKTSTKRSATALLVLLLVSGCSTPSPYGREAQISLDAPRKQVWAVAPAVNLSGQGGVDPLLQADIAYGQLQQVQGITGIPVNRVAEVYASLHLEQVQSVEQAAMVCDLLGCDALLVPTVTLYDPYDPPRFGAALQLFRKPSAYDRANAPDPRALARQATPGENESLPPPSQGNGFRQAVGMFDASNGSTRDALSFYASGRSDPTGPLGEKIYRVDMDRFCGFAYWSLIRRLTGDQANDSANRAVAMRGSDKNGNQDRNR